MSTELRPNVDDLIIEDGEPVESIFAEKQLRLLTEPLYSSWSGPGEGRSFVALADVGLFFAVKQPPLAPDVMLSLDVQVGDLSQRENRSYFVWEFGKPPDVVVEFVSDRRGGEAGHKFRQYARVGVTYYVIFDPEDRLGGGELRSFVLNGGEYQPLAEQRFPRVGLGLTLWEGAYEGSQGHWLRWCDLQGKLIPTARERIDEERRRREHLEARLRELGLEP
jgi:Uma2 family endonuclease